MNRINCPECGRCLGETNHSIDALLLCKTCKKKVRVNLDILSSNYFDYNFEKERRK